MTGGVVTLPAAVRRAIAAHAREAYPHECCGLLVGRGLDVAFAVRMANVAAAARNRYQLDPAAHIALRKVLRDVRPPLAILGAYHSHPQGAAEPSATDCAEAHYPEWVHVIAGMRGGRVRLAAFRIRAGRAARLTMG